MSRTITFECAHCGKERTVPQSYYHRRKTHYCTKECASAGAKKPPRPVSKPSREERFWSRVDVGPTDDACWMYQGAIFPNGYGRARLDGRAQYAHRVAYILTHGPIKPGNCICHICDTPACCNPHHLFEGTPRDNAQDRDAKLRHTNHRRLSPAQVRRARKSTNLSSAEKYQTWKEIADQSGASIPTVRKAAIGITYLWVE